MKSRLKTGLLLFNLLWLLSCSQDKSKCGGNSICTAVFAGVTVTLTNGYSARVMLDSFYTVNKSRQKIYRFNNTPSFSEFNYTVVTDSEIKDLNKSGTSLEFVGYINSMEVIRQPFIVGHDCCHILKISGPDSVKITGFSNVDF